MLLIYVAPNGSKYQYEEGTQPDGYVLADVQSKGYVAPKKARAPRNKARKAENK